MVRTYLWLCLGFSTPVWLLLARMQPGEESMALSFAIMWCPGVAAIVTRAWYQRSLRGMGFGLGPLRWVAWAFAVPVLVGLVAHGTGWISGLAPLDRVGLAQLASPAFAQTFLVGLALNGLAALGEEIGWRGLLVPEMARRRSFTSMALITGFIWMAWHLPAIVFTNYHGTGSLVYSLAAFIPLVVAWGVVQAWLRLISGSVWVATVLHGTWNYFIQSFYPALTVRTPAGGRMLGEFGWILPPIVIVVACLFWRLRHRLPNPRKTPD